MAKKKFPTYRCVKSFTGDLEYTMYKFVAGKTYTDDRTTVLDVYIDGYFEPAEPDENTIVVHHPHG